MKHYFIFVCWKEAFPPLAESLTDLLSPFNRKSPKMGMIRESTIIITD